ncbi:MAG: O-antigen ligase family protein [Candidatus Aminicenantes bacterium]|nr:O-antigen ligase family protein [Candidatus Aminicenantes bacterium]
MNKNKRHRLLLGFTLLLYVGGFTLFYSRYVPLLKSFQIALVVPLLINFILACLKKEWGILFFVGAFPLINNLPYMFGIFETSPHAPTALVLFLAFFLGYLINQMIHPAEAESPGNPDILKPLLLYSGVIAASGIITFIKYANFTPLLSDRIYELIVNTNMVTAGGALMSVVFNSLNYLTGFLFFFILAKSLKTREFLNAALVLLSLSTFIALVFSLVQKFLSLSLGNTPHWINAQQINATFKDPNSFGVFLSSCLPLFLGLAFFGSKAMRLFSSVLIVFSLFVFPSIGSRSAFLGLITAFGLFFLLTFLKGGFVRKKGTHLAVILTIALVVIVVAAVLFRNTKLYSRLSSNVKDLRTNFSVNLLFSGKPGFWSVASRMAGSYPLTGVGIGGFIVELPNYYKLKGLPLDQTDAAENYLFQVWSELGLLGLLLVFWLFVTIIKEMRKSFSRIPRGDKSIFLLNGAIAGVVSFFVNFQFHTYIGSYEAKYMFWFLVGIIFALGRIYQKPEEEEEKNLFSIKFKIAGAILILTFASVHLWNSAHSLSLKTSTARYGLQQDFGVDKLEKTDDGREFRWTRSYGGLTLKVEKPVMEISLLASHPDIRKNPVRVKIYIVKGFFKEKKLLAELTLKYSIWEKYEFSIPEDLNQTVILLIKVSRTWNPLKTFGTPDPRNLGVAVGPIQFKDKSGP